MTLSQWLTAKRLAKCKNIWKARIYPLKSSQIRQVLARQAICECSLGLVLVSVRKVLGRVLGNKTPFIITTNGVLNQAINSSINSFTLLILLICEMPLPTDT